MNFSFGGVNISKGSDTTPEDKTKNKQQILLLIGAVVAIIGTIVLINR